MDRRREAVPSSEDEEAAGRLGRLLSDAGYDEGAVAGRLGIRPHRTVWGVKTPLYLRRTAEPTALNAFIRLFFLGGAVDPASAQAAFAPLALGDVEAMGLVRLEDGQVRAPLALSPYRGFIVAHDPWGPNTETHELSVPGIAGSPRWLDRFTVRQPVGTALDLGTGSGVQALLASRHARSVVATDLNPRAVAFARFNAQLNQVNSIEVLEGDLFEPVNGTRFDLVVCNPPYVVTPAITYLFSDGGISPGGLTERILRGSAEHLNESGFACAVAEWGVRDDQDWSDEPRRWLSGGGTDVLVVGNGEIDPASYAADQNASVAADPVAFDRALTSWLEAYAGAGISRIASGAIVQRRRTGRSWVHAERRIPRSGDLSAHLIRIVLGRTVMQEASRDELLELRPSLADVVIEERHDASDGRLALRGLTLRPATGLRFALTISGEERSLVASFDGSTSVRELLRGRDDDGIDRALDAVRMLLAHGFVELDTG